MVDHPGTADLQKRALFAIRDILIPVIVTAAAVKTADSLRSVVLYSGEFEKVTAGSLSYRAALFDRQAYEQEDQ
jgi:hypothetical protein